jgi:outer membrane protein OmpA-like peptidoglycan-associated protein
MTKKRLVGWSAGLIAMATATAAFGQDQAGASGSLSLSSSEGASASGDANASGDSDKDYEPEDMMFEAGAFLGLMLPSSDHNLREDINAQAGVATPHEEYAGVAPEFGGRIAFYPIKYVGGELEGGWLPTSTETDDSASIFAGRLHLIGQFPLGRITPFALIGGGALGAGSKPMGNDTDPALHFGLGVKYGITPAIAIRADLRDTMAQKVNEDDGTLTHFPELLVGVAFQLAFRGKKEAAPVAAPKDTDADGFTDDKDQCPKEPGIAPSGCPDKDTDGDGVMDSKDVCPAEAGKTACGCPIKDTDGDGLPDDFDKCPTEPGPNNGCPDLDADKDGINTPDDKCPEQPETKNGFDDADGCPDEIPEKIRKFSGVIAGIEFDTGKDTIRPTSEPVLTNAAAILAEYPQLKIEISGHTDNVGSEESNVDLSKRRADSVKAWFVAKGIAAERMTTRGAGPKEPIADNKTAAGKQKNRRIEFKLQ